MVTVVLAMKAGLAVMLVGAGAAKLADVSGFAATVRLFVPRVVPRFTLRAAAIGTAVMELLVGGASFSFPAVGLVNVLVLVAACTFVVTSILGYLFHRNVACRCFGPLSRRAFDAGAVVRSIAIAALATIVVAATISPAAIHVTTVAHALLLAAATLLALATFAAARTLAAVSDAQLSPGVATR